MVVATRLLLVTLFSAFLLYAANAYKEYPGQHGQHGQTGIPLTQAQQCRLQRLTGSQPSQRIESEGGFTELWDENEEQFQCVGVAPMRNVLRPNSLSLPNFHPMPRLVYIEQGRGLISVIYPGCAETFQSQPGFQAGQEPREERGQGRRGDQHQKVHRIRQGDVVAIPAGAAHWCYNDGEEELVAVSINDLNHQSNQLDQNFRAFYLAGGVQESASERSLLRKQGTQQRFQNIFRAFDADLMAEAFNIPVEIVRKMQEEQSERGLIVNVREGMSMIRPDEGEEEEFEGQQGGPCQRQKWWKKVTGNGLEENICTMKIRTNMETYRHADIYSRQAGKIKHVNSQKLPILRDMDMSASKGNLYPNALMSPHWSVSGHSLIYVQRGDAQVQVVDQNGQQVMNDRVNQGEMFVVPQYYASTVKAGQNGFEFTVFRTSSEPMNSQLAGYTSVIRAMPIEVLTNAYQISPNEAQRLKMNRGGESFLLSPQRQRGPF